jgi:hypothetical protein
LRLGAAGGTMECETDCECDRGRPDHVMVVSNDPRHGTSWLNLTVSPRHTWREESPDRLTPAGSSTTSCGWLAADNDESLE